MIINSRLMFRLKNLNILGSKAELAALPEGKLLINTINAHSYNTARKDELFAEALTNGDVLIPDGVSRHSSVSSWPGLHCAPYRLLA